MYLFFITSAKFRRENEENYVISWNVLALFLLNRFFYTKLVNLLLVHLIFYFHFYIQYIVNISVFGRCTQRHKYKNLIPLLFPNQLIKIWINIVQQIYILYYIYFFVIVIIICIITSVKAMNIDRIYFDGFGVCLFSD